MARTYSMDNRAAVTLAVRERIIEAALDELAAAPQGAITLAEVAARADLAVRTLYNHFPSRDALLTAAFVRHGSLSRAAIAAVSAPDAPPEKQLRYLIGAYYGRYADMGLQLTSMLALRGFPALAEQVTAIQSWRRQVLGAVIASAREQNLLATGEGTALALAFTVTSHAHWQVLTNELPHEDPATITADALCKAILHA